MASIIKTDNIQKVSDDSNIIKKCGSTTTVGSGAGNTITVDGATVTLGRCGGTVSLASGATQSGFGRTGTVDWCTTAKTSPFTAVSGDGFFVNTTSGAITVTLPASPSAGDIISLKDYANTWDTNSVTLCRNGSKINGVCANAALNTESQSVTLIYVDGTKGWQDIQDSTSNVSGTTFIAATGGTITTDGNFKIHTFTSDGCFAVSGLATDPANSKIDYLVVAGGGSGGWLGGGGAGGYRESHCATTSGCYTASPLASAASLPISITSYPVAIGAGGSYPVISSGSPSTFSSITSTGGGKGGDGGTAADSGGSGGGGPYAGPVTGGAGNTPPVNPPQGNPGGTGWNQGGWNEKGGGGGGATTAGGNAPGPRDGGTGAGTAINLSAGVPGPSPTLKYFAGGGGGGNDGTAGGGSPGAGGGGTGGIAGGPGGGGTQIKTAGVVNTGGGGGGNSSYNGCRSGAGGSGVVIIRYKFQ